MTSIDSFRCTGRTASQMQSAPLNAVFVWCNCDSSYPKMIADKIGRTDLTIVNPSWLDSYRWRGLILSGIIVDHAAKLTDAQLAALNMASAYIR